MMACTQVEQVQEDVYSTWMSLYYLDQASSSLGCLPYRVTVSNYEISFFYITLFIRLRLFGVNT